MAAVISGVDRRARLSTLVLDVLVSEEVELGLDVTDYVVEDGSTISDHIVAKPEKIRIAGDVAIADVLSIESGAFEPPGEGVTDAAALARSQQEARDSFGAKMVDVVAALRKLHADRALVTISTAQMRYEDYAFENLRAVRSSGGDGGNWLSIQAGMKLVRKVELRTASVPERAAEPAKGRTGETNKQAGKSGSGGAQSRQGTEPRPITPGRAIVKNVEERLGVVKSVAPGLGVVP